MIDMSQCPSSISNSVIAIVPVSIVRDTTEGVQADSNLHYASLRTREELVGNPHHACTRQVSNIDASYLRSPHIPNEPGTSVQGYLRSIRIASEEPSSCSIECPTAQRYSAIVCRCCYGAAKPKRTTINSNCQRVRKGDVGPKDWRSGDTERGGTCDDLSAAPLLRR